MRPRSILLIDDNDQIRTLLRRVLEEAGYFVMDAANGREGIQQFRETPAELVITDLLMPDSDGLEVTMTLRRESPHVKIIALTGGVGNLNLLEVAKLLGAHRTMKKPFEMTDLLEAVQQVLQEGLQHKEPGSQDIP
ncbi:MAG: response regulator [Nitrospirota bacterium]|nr:response regulator [Nitrospirota bacterium]MDP2384710.1 response regulator [Nitrospirota bacterium]MDP3599244.1 response regulator [Nitrospirota bacterium]